MSGKLVAISLLGLTVIGGTLGLGFALQPRNDREPRATPPSDNTSVRQPQAYQDVPHDITTTGVNKLGSKTSAQMAKAQPVVVSPPQQAPAIGLPTFLSANPASSPEPLTADVPVETSQAFVPKPITTGAAANRTVATSGIAATSGTMATSRPAATLKSPVKPSTATGEPQRITVAQLSPAPRNTSPKAEVSASTAKTTQITETVTVVAPKPFKAARVDIDSLGRGNSLTIDLPRKK